MQAYQKAFIDFALQLNVLKFGQFTLKSGRKSPYFYNSGLFNTGSALAKLGSFYAAAIQDAGIEFDTIFGPAYKGIPLVCSTSIALSQEYNNNVPYSFNRKEAKDHGEAGNIVGSPLSGKVLIIDDVITAGTAIRESIPLIETANGQLAGIIISLDRQEKGQGELSAIQEIEKQYNIPVISIIKLEHLLEYLKQQNNMQDTLKDIMSYRESYGVDA